MILLIVWAEPQADRADDFERAIERVASAARQLPGCIRYEWYQTPGSERKYVTFGEFATRTSFEDYLKSDVVKWIGESLIPLLKSKPAFKHYEATVFKQS